MLRGIVEKIKIGDVWMSNKDRDEITIKHNFGKSVGVYSKKTKKEYTISTEYLLKNYIR